MYSIVLFAFKATNSKIFLQFSSFFLFLTKVIPKYLRHIEKFYIFSQPNTHTHSQTHTHLHAKHKFEIRSNDFISGWVVACFKLHETLFAVAADLKFMAQVFALDAENPKQPKEREMTSWQPLKKCIHCVEYGSINWLKLV